MKILITGGLGYIGSHTTVELFKQNDEIIVVDNLINSRIEILDQIEKISGRKPKYYNVDVLDKENLDKVFKENQIDAVIHFAALKAVGESVEKPLEYYHNNISGTINLLNVMRENNVKKIIFSSSATVYGDSEVMPVHEELPLMPATNPYGKTKVMMEEILTDVQKSDDEW
ncbi:MAG: SDR family NAD(P)-dependent oxidoreductase, partial [Clostridium sp.]|uniref:SDR family NAD(P)-dependent oxidoreductase n=1 Tax=Clostridium sp. TaxID=1506 RepID=UPI003F3CD7D3